LFEEPYMMDTVPIVPITLCPTKMMLGQSMSAELWQTQVRIDKLLAKLLWCAQQAGAEKYRLGLNMKSKMEEQIPSLHLTEAGSPEKALKNGGIDIVFADQGQMEKFESEVSLQQLHAEFEAAKRDMEYIAGISQPYQGIEPQRVTAGVAINMLATMSSKGVQRKATFLAEGLRDYALFWAKYTLMNWGLEYEGTDVMVSLIPQEELTKSRQVETLVRISDIIAKSNVPQLGEFLVDIIPGLSVDQKARLKEIFEQSQAMMEQQVAPGEEMPETAEGMSPEASEEYQGMGMPEPPMPEEEEASMAGAFEPLPNAPAVTY